MKTNQLQLSGCLKNIVKSYLRYFIALEISMMLKDLLIEFKPLLEVKKKKCGQLETLNLYSHLKTKLHITLAQFTKENVLVN